MVGGTIVRFDEVVNSACREQMGIQSPQCTVQAASTLVGLKHARKEFSEMYMKDWKENRPVFFSLALTCHRICISDTPNKMKIPALCRFAPPTDASFYTSLLFSRSPLTHANLKSVQCTDNINMSFRYLTSHVVISDFDFHLAPRHVFHPPRPCCLTKSYRV